ncbi:hypothetical protein RUND412_005361 [Rhizina undulata]
MLGLILYGIGSLLFWPAGVNRSFGGFCGATFVIGSGLGTLESAANPYLAVCGPPRYSEVRLNLAQAVQAVGTIVGLVLASQVFFKNVGEDGNSLKSVQWVYLGIAVFVFLLSGVFYLAEIPEITDADMERQVEETGVRGWSRVGEGQKVGGRWSSRSGIWGGPRGHSFVMRARRLLRKPSSKPVPRPPPPQPQNSLPRPRAASPSAASEAPG